MRSVGLRGTKGAILASCALIIAIAVFAFALRSSATLPLTWDEGDAFNRGSQLIAWLDALLLSPPELRAKSDADASKREQEARRYFSALPSRGALFAEEPLAAAFPHVVYREGHPPGASWTIALSRRVAPALGLSMASASSYRVWFLLLFATAVGAVFYRVARSFGLGTGLLIAVLIVSSPRLFAHAQIAGGDSLLISSWALAWSLFDAARRSWRYATLWGVAIAISLSAKFSGFILPIPFALVALIELLRRRNREQTLACARLAFGFALALAIFFAISPVLWRAPFKGFAAFWTLNTERSEFNIPIYFFGEFYSPTRPLPWWNGFFWPLATLPSSLLALCCFGFFRRGRRVIWGREGFERAFWTAVALAVALPITRGFPGLPVHDGSRLLIASTLFWSIPAGLGARWLALRGSRFVARQIANVNNRERRSRRRRRFLRASTCLIALVASHNLFVLIDVAPQYLSYYNALIGGVVGATRRGFEPTYYWDALDAEVATGLRAAVDRSRQSGDSSGLLFGSFSSQTLDYYAQWNAFGTEELATISEPSSVGSLTQFGYYVVQNRPSGLTPFDVAVIKDAQPIFIKRVKNPGLSRLFRQTQPGVVVLRVYDMRDVLRVVSQPPDQG